MFKKGIYRVYFITHRNDIPNELLVGRFSHDNDGFNVLEDHHHILSDILHDGDFTDHHEKVLNHLSNSTYYKLVPEFEINEGHHEDITEELDDGFKEPDAQYIIHPSDTEQPPMMLEFYGTCAILNGEKITDEQLNDLMNRVRAGEFRKIPI